MVEGERTEAGEHMLYHSIYMIEDLCGKGQELIGTNALRVSISRKCTSLTA